MRIAADLRTAWSIAAGMPKRGGLRAIPLDITGKRVWATVNDRSQRGILVEIQSHEIIGPTIEFVARKSTALAAELYSFEDNGARYRGLHIWVLADDLLEAFTGF